MLKVAPRLDHHIMPKSMFINVFIMKYKTDFIDLGQIEYKKAWGKQETWNQEIKNAKMQHIILPGKLIFCEHPHVYTLGRSGKENNLLINNDFLKKINASYYVSNRGGDITYHGPGQIVGYPIFDLEALKIGVKEYINKLENGIIQTLKDYNIIGTRLDGATGVWLDKDTPNTRKICAIGVRVSRAVTMHGFALNVNTDLNYFNYINPCGFLDKGVTSMEKELGHKLNFEEVKQNLREKLEKYFQP